MKNKFGFVSAAFFLSLAFAASAAAQDAAAPSGNNAQEKQPPTCKVIRTVQYPVSQTRTKNQKMRIALLDLCPKDRGMVARPMLPVMINGAPEMFEYDVVRVFKNKKEAAKYAKENDIKDVGN